jgi:phospholipid N-methyltransferase
MALSDILASYLRFAWAGVIKHEQTGGLVPSQRFLVGKMIAPVPSTYRGQMLELGAGTGALTLRLALKCPTARILACEINPDLAKTAKNNLTRAGLNGNIEIVSVPAAEVLTRIIRGEAEQPEFIFSGIPLGNLGREEALALIRSINDALKPGGWYIQFQHSLVDRKKIKTTFSKLYTVPVLLNLPPAFIYYAQK